MMVTLIGKHTLKKVEKEQTWKKTQETLKKLEASEPKTDAQKKSKVKRIKTLNEQIKKQKSNFHSFSLFYSDLKGS